MSYRVLVVGTGSIGHRHTRCFLATGRADVGICELNDQVRDEVAGLYDLVGAYASLDEALDQKWDAVVVATPAHLHVPMALEVVKRDLAIMIEKPLSTSQDGLADLADEIDRRRLPTMVAYTLRSHPVITAMRAAIAEGRFGKPIQVISVSGHHFPHDRPAYREIYYTRRETGGGAIQDALTHTLNASEWIVGPIDRVAADAQHLSLEGTTVEDTVHLMTRQGSVMGSYCLNQYQCPNENTFTVVCEGGTVRCELHKTRWRWMVEHAGEWHDEPAEVPERDSLYIWQANAFFDVLEGKAKPLCTLHEAWQTLKASLAILKSADTGGGWQDVC